LLRAYPGVVEGEKEGLVACGWRPSRVLGPRERRHRRHPQLRLLRWVATQGLLQGLPRVVEGEEEGVVAADGVLQGAGPRGEEALHCAREPKAGAGGGGEDQRRRERERDKGTEKGRERGGRKERGGEVAVWGNGPWSASVDPHLCLTVPSSSSYIPE